MRKGLSFGRVARPALALAIAIGSVSCGDVVRQGRGGSYAIIDRLEASMGGQDSKVWEGVLTSDVQTGGGVFEDEGRVTMRVAMKDPTITAPTSTNAITFTRHRVEFRRSDGRNVQGVDVPYAFDGAATFTVASSSAVQHTFTIVRAHSKLEPPLITMAGLGGAIAISTIADITFYGRDQAGNEVEVKGSIGVNFADWGDK